MIPAKPVQIPSRCNFGSGPCSKRPGFDPAVAYKDAAFGRSHRSKLGLGKIQKSVQLTREILGIPDDYLVGIVPASDTGAMEMTMWNMCGIRPVTCVYFDAFGKEWFTDLTTQLKLDITAMQAPYGKLPDLSKVDFASDVIFTWNGTTAGVRIPNGDWIKDDREGLTICDATSAVFAMEMPWEKLDVVTYSWQKVLGGEAAHGILILSPRAVTRLEEYTPSWPLPKIFRLKKGAALNKAIFTGSVINTVSLMCVEDYIDALEWAKGLGGLPALIERSRSNLAVLTKFAEEHKDWIKFLCDDESCRSNTSVTMVIKDLEPAKVKEMTALLAEMDAAYDINSYRDAPAGIRIWCGATVDASDLEAFCPWLEWAHYVVKESVQWKLRIAVTDGMAPSGVQKLQKAGFEVVQQFFKLEELEAGVLADFDAVVIRSATKLREKAIRASAKEGSKLKVIARAGVGVDNVDIPIATECGLMVVNAPCAATMSVAELALSHLLSSCRDLHPADRALRDGKWIKSKLKGTEVAGKNLGFVGFGRIGQGLARLCQMLGMNIHAYDPYLPKHIAEEFPCVLHDTIEGLFKACTHISVHCFLSPETHHIVNMKLFKLMPGVAPDGTKCGNHIVSCARGGVVDEDSCLEALKAGVLKTVALDVFEKEPVDPANPLLQADGFHGTPHIGASTIEAQNRVGEEITETVIAALNGSVPMSNFVNKDVVPRAQTSRLSALCYPFPRHSIEFESHVPPSEQNK